MGALASLGGGQAGFVEQVANPPLFQVAAAIGPTSIALTWTLVPGALAYAVYCGLSPEAMSPQAQDIVGGAYTISGLTLGQTYFVQVLAVLSARASVAGEFVLPSGAAVAVLQAATVLSRDLVWTSSIYGYPVISRNMVLANLAQRIRGPGVDVESTVINDADAIGYVEVQLINPQAGVQGTGNFCGIVGLPVSTGPVVGFQWGQGGAGDTTLEFVASNDPISQQVLDFGGLPDFSAVIGLVIDSPNLQAWVSYNGLFWDTVSQTFLDNYTDCAPSSLVLGGRTVMVSTILGTPE